MKTIFDESINRSFPFKYANHTGRQGEFSTYDARHSIYIQTIAKWDKISHVLVVDFKLETYDNIEDIFQDATKERVLETITKKSDAQRRAIQLADEFIAQIEGAIPAVPSDDEAIVALKKRTEDYPF